MIFYRVFLLSGGKSKQHRGSQSTTVMDNVVSVGDFHLNALLVFADISKHAHMNAHFLDS